MMDDWSTYMYVRAAIRDMLDTRFYTIKWLDEEIYSGRARIWGRKGSAIIATLKTYPTGNTEVHGLVAVGDAMIVRDLIPLAELWGKRCGAIVASIDSREGWSRLLAADGYKVYQTCLRKEL